jgi:hypothetical protein
MKHCIYCNAIDRKYNKVTSNVDFFLDLVVLYPATAAVNPNAGKEYCHERRIGNLREKGAWHRGPGAFFVVTIPT